MSTDKARQPGERLVEHEEGYRTVHDAIVAVLGPRPSEEDVRALRVYIDTMLSAADATEGALVRVLGPDEPGFNLRVGEIAAQQESTAEFFAFLDGYAPAARHADPR